MEEGISCVCTIKEREEEKNKKKDRLELKRAADSSNVCVRDGEGLCGTSGTRESERGDGELPLVHGIVLVVVCEIWVFVVFLIG